MTANEREKIDKFIKEYLLIDIRIKILKAKIKHSEYNNCKSASIRYNDKINELEKFRGIIQSNVKSEYLENMEIFKMDLDEAMQVLSVSKSTITKLKAKIRNEFIKVIDLVEAD